MNAKVVFMAPAQTKSGLYMKNNDYATAPRNRAEIEIQLGIDKILREHHRKETRKELELPFQLSRNSFIREQFMTPDYKASYIFSESFVIPRNSRVYDTVKKNSGKRIFLLIENRLIELRKPKRMGKKFTAMDWLASGLRHFYEESNVFEKISYLICTDLPDSMVDRPYHRRDSTIQGVPVYHVLCLKLDHNPDEETGLDDHIIDFMYER